VKWYFEENYGLKIYKNWLYVMLSYVMII